MIFSALIGKNSFQILVNGIKQLYQHDAESWRKSKIQELKLIQVDLFENVNLLSSFRVVDFLLNLARSRVKIYSPSLLNIQAVLDNNSRSTQKSSTANVKVALSCFSMSFQLVVY